MRWREEKLHFAVTLVVMLMLFLLAGTAWADAIPEHPKPPRGGFPRELPPETSEGLLQGGGLSGTYSVEGTRQTGHELTISAEVSGGDGNYSYAFSLWTHDRLGIRSTILCAMYHMEDKDRSDRNSWTLKFYEPGIYYIDLRAWDESGHTWQVPISRSNSFEVTGDNLVDQKVKSLADQFRNTCISDFDRALAAHDYLVQNANYDYSYTRHMPQGVLFDGLGVCESYARSYYLILKELGMDVIYVIGKGGSSSHAWNLHRIDGSWYGVDCTWDDPGTGGRENHLYFSLDDTALGYEHTAQTYFPMGSIPECTTLKDHYYIRNGTVEKWVSVLREEIDARLDSGNPTFELNVLDSDIIIEGGMYSTTGIPWYLVTYVLNKNIWEDGEKKFQLQAEYNRSDRVILIRLLRKIDGDLKDADIEIVGEYMYTGKEIIPSIRVTLADKELKEGLDYNTAYENHLNAGTATVIISGLEDATVDHAYAGQCRREFQIQPRPLEQTLIKTAQTRFIYTGKPKSPKVVIHFEDTLLSPENYEVHYQNQTEVGNGLAVVTGKDNLIGETELVFTILPAGENLAKMPENLSILEDDALEGTAFREIQFPDKMVIVQGSPFVGMDIIQIRIPNSGCQIAPEVFNGLSDMTLIAPIELKIGNLPVQEFCMIQGFYFENE